MRIGILTGGGDCPGLNAAIRAIVRRAVVRGDQTIGFANGWAGMLEDQARPLSIESTAGILARGGTILGTSRTNPFAQEVEDGLGRIRATFAAHALDGLIAIGGEDTLGVALKLAEAELPVVGIPKTIDNDISETDYTIGFQTAVAIVAEAIDRLHSTAESHHRVMVVEVMGRHAGWIATHAGIAGGADAILIPEQPFDIESVCRHLRTRRERGRSFSIVVAAEGAIPRAGNLQVRSGGGRDSFGHVRLGGIGITLEEAIEQRTGFETRATILGHVQRGGTPSAFDRVLATRLGVAAVDAIAAGESGVMVALQGTAIRTVSLQRALSAPKLVDPDLYATAEVFFG
ncbi:MAG TPA: 6-phosphofructokinase [Solirubrobacteraceae bacterium]|nr:6-phosphofructokinase [Solirubrobacteraceae bacterium]